MVEVGDDVFYVFYAYGEADEVGGYAGFAELFVCELAVGVAGRVEDAGAGIGYVGHDGDEFELIHEFDCLFAGAFQSEGNNATSAVGHLFFCEVVVFVAFKTGIVDPSHLRMLLKPLSHFQCVLAVAWYAEMESLKPEVEEEGIVR